MKQQAQALVQTQQKNTVASSLKGGMLQRKCACGQHTVADDECEECRKKGEGMIQRAAVSAASVNAVPPVVHDVLSLPGQPLDAATRAFMEPRFGHDFSQVRVHTDEQAAESAQAVNALAYTVGRDVVFGAGQYAPRTNQGRGTIAHELTHVVQQSSMSGSGPLTLGPMEDNYEREADAMGSSVIQSTENYRHSNHTVSSAADTTQLFVTPGLNHSFSRVHIQRIPDEPKKGKKSVVAAGVSEPMENLVTDILNIVQSDMKKRENDVHAYKESLKLIVEQIEKPRSTAAKKQKEFPKLYEEVLVNRLAQRKDRPKISEEVVTRLTGYGCLAYRLSKALEATGESLGILDKPREHAPKTPGPACLAQEIQEFPAFAQKELIDALEKYQGVREALTQKFGADLGKAKTYYRTIVQAQFFGRSVWVHPTMKDHLQKAQQALEDWLKQEDQVVKNLRVGVAGTMQLGSRVVAKVLEGHVQGVRQWLATSLSIKGVEIRAKVGASPAKGGGINLSEHAFGCAVDINATSNNYVLPREFPLALVKELTGVDVFEGEAAQSIRSAPGKGGGKMETILPQISTLVEASDVFKKTSKEFFKNKESLKVGLINYLEKQGAKIRGQIIEENLKEQGARITEEQNIEKQFNALFEKIEDAYKEQIEENRRQDSAKKRKGKQPREIQHYPNLASYKTLKNWITTYIGVDAKKSQEVVNFLLEAYEVFVRTRDEKGELRELTQEEAKAVTATAPTIALKGFINLPPELIAALVSSGLKWLGVTPTVKDFMHFELTTCDLSVPSKKETKMEGKP